MNRAVDIFGKRFFVSLSVKAQFTSFVAISFYIDIHANTHTHTQVQINTGKFPKDDLNVLSAPCRSRKLKARFYF